MKRKSHLVSLGLAICLIATSAPSLAQDTTLDLKLHSVPTSHQHQQVDIFKHKHIDRRVRRARITLISSALATVAGIAIAAVGAARGCEGYDNTSLNCASSDRKIYRGGANIASIGMNAMVGSGIALGVFKGKRRRLRKEQRLLESATTKPGVPGL